MLKTPCERCGNNGLAQYSHNAGGQCFKCGRLPEASEAPRYAEHPDNKVASPRAKSIHTLHTFILCLAERNPKRQEYWLKGDEEFGVPGYRAWLREEVQNAPADVRERAIKALAKIGVTV
jgi:hypothetical protein